MTEQEPAVIKIEYQDQKEPDDGVPIVLVTGASGFVATHLIKQLLEQGRYRVRGLVQSPCGKINVIMTLGGEGVLVHDVMQLHY